MSIKDLKHIGITCVIGMGLFAEASAQDQFTTIPDAEKIQWADTGPPFPNTQITVLSGDPSKGGPFVARWRCPDNYKIAPHVHPATEAVTVIQGTFHVGRGEKFDEAALTALKPGGFMVMPGGVTHYAMCKGLTIIELHATGPWGTKMLHGQ